MLINFSETRLRQSGSNTSGSAQRRASLSPKRNSDFIPVCFGINNTGARLGDMVMCRPKSRFGSIQPGGKFYRLVSTVRYHSPRNTMHEHFSLSLSDATRSFFETKSLETGPPPCSSLPNWFPSFSKKTWEI